MQTQATSYIIEVNLVLIALSLYGSGRKHREVQKLLNDEQPACSKLGFLSTLCTGYSLK